MKIALLVLADVALGGSLMVWLLPRALVAWGVVSLVKAARLEYKPFPNPYMEVNK